MSDKHTPNPKHEHSGSASIPVHVAITMDGNNRWAKQKGLGGGEGHRAGAETVKSSIKFCGESGVKVLTVFAFSSENWARPQNEVDTLMGLFLDSLTNEVGELHEKGIRIRFVGELSRFSSDIQAGMQEAVDLTAGNAHMDFVVAINYGGRWDILNAAKTLAKNAQSPGFNLDAVGEDEFSRLLCLGDLPPVDLLIRTGAEQRISNFLLWQIAYAELYFSDILWPDFDADALSLAFADFASRQRRFGQTSEQLEALS